jgi:hypothetical protein
MNAKHDATNLETRDLRATPTPTRRGLLRFAAGALATLGLAAIAGADGAAGAKGGQRRGETRTGAAAIAANGNGRTQGRGNGDGAAKGKGKGKGKNARCRPGKGIARLEIPSDGRTVETLVLLKGRTYRMRASGFVGLANADGGPAIGLPAVDADYGFFRQGAPRPNDRVGGLDWGLAVDGKVPAWGAFTEDHAYTLLVAGRGKPLTLDLVYGDEFAPDGQGSLVLEIECA